MGCLHSRQVLMKPPAAGTRRRGRPPLPPLAFASPSASLEKVKAAFEAMDLNGDGVLQPTEVKEYLHSVGYGSDEAERFVRRADINGPCDAPR